MIRLSCLMGAGDRNRIQSMRLLSKDVNRFSFEVVRSRVEVLEDGLQVSASLCPMFHLLTGLMTENKFATIDGFEARF